jgi:hypothetical protein
MKKILLFFVLLINYQYTYSQVVFGGGLIPTVAAMSMPEHGFLPGKKFPFYETIEKYNFDNQKIKIVLYDNRKSLNLTKIDCSDTALTNSSEFKNEQAIYKIWEYIDKFAKDSKIIIDKDATDEYEITLMALDIRLIGFGSIDVHGLCQIKVKHNGVEKTYCTDIQDGDKNSPLNKSSFVSRKTATRFMMSAAIRETIEKFIKDINDL